MGGYSQRTITGGFVHRSCSVLTLFLSSLYMDLYGEETYTLPLFWCNVYPSTLNFRLISLIVHRNVHMSTNSPHVHSKVHIFFRRPPTDSCQVGLFRPRPPGPPHCPMGQAWVTKEVAPGSRFSKGRRTRPPRGEVGLSDSAHPISPLKRLACPSRTVCRRPLMLICPS